MVSDPRSFIGKGTNNTSSSDDDSSDDASAPSRKGTQAFGKDAGPVYTTCCGHVNVDSDLFNAAVGIVIFINAIIIGLETDLGEQYFVAFEHFFVIFFATEMVLRMSAMGIEYFKDPWCLFDCFLVSSGVLDLYILPIFNGGKGGGHNAQVSMLRMLRMLRVLRILRLFRMFHALMVILKAFMKAFASVMWVGLLVVILDYVVAIFLVQVVGHQAHLWGDKAGQIENWFGTIGASFRTLVVIMTLSDWDAIAYTLMDVYPGIVVMPFFMFYIIVVAYTMVSLVTGIISESLVTAQQQDEQFRLHQLAEEKTAQTLRIKQILKTVDSNNDGIVNKEDILTGIKLHEELLTKLSTLELVMDSDDLCHLIDRIAASEGTNADMGVSTDKLAEVLADQAGDATAASVFDLKHMVNTLAREGKAQRAELQGEVLKLMNRIERMR